MRLNDINIHDGLDILIDRILDLNDRRQVLLLAQVHLLPKLRLIDQVLHQAPLRLHAPLRILLLQELKRPRRQASARLKCPSC